MQQGDSVMGLRVRIVRVGVALGPTLVTACEARGLIRAVPGRRSAAALPSAGTPQWQDALETFFAELRAAGATEIHVTLLRPLSSTKSLRLPPLPGSATRRIAELGVSRWFTHRGSVAVDVAPLSRRTPAGEGPNTLVSICDTGVSGAIAAAARGAGLAVASVSPSAFAVAGAAVRVLPSSAVGEQLLLVFFSHATEGVMLRDGRPVWVRSVPFRATGDANADLAARSSHLNEFCAPATGAAPPLVTLIGELGAGGEHALGIAPEAVLPLRSLGLPDAEATAAFGAALSAARTHDLRPQGDLARLRRAALRRSAFLCAAAGVLSAVSAATHLGNLERAGESAAEQRRLLRPAVASVLRTRSEIDSLHARLAAMVDVESRRPRWVPLLARLTEAMPRDSYIQSLRSEGATVYIDGFTRSASSLVLALGRTPEFQNVGFTAPVQRELTARGERERFSVRFESPILLPPHAEGNVAGAVGGPS
ncbi:MAG TPA: PilN domain-containing protein [Longimicrobium sp.]|jgi:Tfp pilus assembly protein PilN